MRTLTAIIIALLSALTPTNAAEPFGPPPGSDSNPLLNVDFHHTVEPFWFLGASGYEPAFKNYIGYRAEYADGTIKTDSMRLVNNPAQNLAFFTETPLGSDCYEYLVKPEFIREIDEDARIVSIGSVNSVAVYRMNNDYVKEQILYAIREGRREFHVSCNDVPDSDDISYDKADPGKIYETDAGPQAGSAALLAPGVYDSNYLKGFSAYLLLYSEDMAAICLQIENGVFVHNVYFEELNTASVETPELLDCRIETTLFGNKYGYEESMRVDLVMDIGYCGYTVQSRNSKLMHFYDATRE